MKHDLTPIDFKIPGTETIIPIIMIPKKIKDERGNWVEQPPTPYMQVPQRLVWFNIERQDWTIETSLEKEWIMEGKDDKGEYKDNMVTFKCTISDSYGKIKRTARKTKAVYGAKDYDSCETGSIGRCLALLGYGTAYAQSDMEEDDEVDSPTELKKEGKPATASVTPMPKPVLVNTNKVVEEMGKLKAMTGTFTEKTFDHIFAFDKNQDFKYTRQRYKELAHDKKELDPWCQKYLSYAELRGLDLK